MRVILAVFAVFALALCENEIAINEDEDKGLFPLDDINGLFDTETVLPLFSLEFSQPKEGNHTASSEESSSALRAERIKKKLKSSDRKRKSSRTSSSSSSGSSEAVLNPIENQQGVKEEEEVIFNVNLSSAKKQDEVPKNKSAEVVVVDTEDSPTAEAASNSNISTDNSSGSNFNSGSSSSSSGGDSTQDKGAIGSGAPSSSDPPSLEFDSDRVLLIGHVEEFETTALMGFLLREPSLQTVMLSRLMSLEQAQISNHFCLELQSKYLENPYKVIIIMLTNREISEEENRAKMREAAISFVKCVRDRQPKATILLQGPRCRDMACTQSIKTGIVDFTTALSESGLGGDTDLPAAVVRAFQKMRHISDFTRRLGSGEPDMNQKSILLEHQKQAAAASSSINGGSGSSPQNWGDWEGAHFQQFNAEQQQQQQQQDQKRNNQRERRNADDLGFSHKFFVGTFILLFLWRSVRNERRRAAARQLRDGEHDV